MPTSTPPFKADVVGSLLRPRPSIDAPGEARTAEKISTASVVGHRSPLASSKRSRCKEASACKICTDGEFHRRHWFLDFLEKINGVEVHGGMPMKFQNEKGEVEFAPPRFEVHGKVRRRNARFVGRRLRGAEAGRRRHGLLPKQPIPSPMCVHFRGGREAIDPVRSIPISKSSSTDLAQVYREEIAALYGAGCRYLQIDDTNLPFLCDPKLRSHVRAASAKIPTPAEALRPA